MGLTEKDVWDALRSVKYPGFTRDIVSFGIVRAVKLQGGRVDLRLELRAGGPAVSEAIARQARVAVESVAGVESVRVEVASAERRVVEKPLLPGVRHAIAVASGKGGVGKSTVAVNLAVALAEQGNRVGLMDADIYGPSIPLMMGVRERPAFDPSTQDIVPFERYGVRFMSLGFFVEPDSAVIWRGPMVMKAVEQLLRDVAWGDLDVLVVDMPPGTGDAQLTLSQKVRLAGAVIVTTPQDVALADAVKGVAMFRKVSVPVLGIVENMSFFTCPHCGQRTEIFGHGGGSAAAERLGVPFLGEIPLDPAIRDGGDTGRPIVVADAVSPQTAAFRRIASRIRDALVAR